MKSIYNNYKKLLIVDGMKNEIIYLASCANYGNYVTFVYIEDIIKY